MSRPVARLLQCLLVAACLGAWLLLVVANWRGQVPTWGLYVGGVSLLVILAGLGRLLEVRSLPADRDVRFADHRVVRDLALSSEGEHAQVLTLELVRELAPGARAVRLRFVGVARLRVEQSDDWPVMHGGLLIEDLGPGRRDGRRYRVRDRHDEAFAFFCREWYEKRA